MSHELRRAVVVWAGFIMLIVACQSHPVRPTDLSTTVRTVPPSPMPTAELSVTVTEVPSSTAVPAAAATATLIPPDSDSPTASATGLQSVPVIDCLLTWEIVGRPTARPSSHFDFDGQSLVYWTYQRPDDRRGLALAVESSGEVRQVYRVPLEPPWQVEVVQVDGIYAAWLEVGWGDDPRVYRLWVFDLASSLPRLITETRPSGQPHIPALALDGNRLAVRALGAEGNTCLYVYDLASGASREPLCSSDQDVLYGDPYLRGSILTYVVEDRPHNCSFVQQTDLDTRETTAHRAVSCQTGLRAAADVSLLIWPEKVLSQETGEISEVRLRGLDRQGNMFDLGGSSTSHYQVCEGRAYWLSINAGESAESREIRSWAPGEPIAVLYRAAPDERILGPVCRGDRIAFINPASRAILGTRMASVPLQCRPASKMPWGIALRRHLCERGLDLS